DSLILFSAGSTHSEPERLVTQARHAITADLIARVRALGLVERVIVATDSRVLAATLQPYDVVLDYDAPSASFAFSTRLAQVIERYDARKVFYLGGGAGALLGDEEIRLIVERLRAEDSV